MGTPVVAIEVASVVGSGGNSTKGMYTHCASLHGVGTQLEGCSGASPL